MVDWYAPGFKAGGPIRSAVNFAHHLEKELDIYVLTSDRDLGSDSPYHGVIVDQWIVRENHHVFYASPAFYSWRNVLRVVKGLNPEYVYLNSMFSRFGTVYPLMMKRFGDIEAKLILAPRGMLKTSALSHKAGKKKLFLAIFKLLGLSRDIVFHVTDDVELNDVRIRLGQHVQLVKLGNFPGRLPEPRKAPRKSSGSLILVFVGRFHPIKNLDYLLRILQDVRGSVQLKVIATEEDRGFQEKCGLLISQLPANIETSILLNVPHEKIHEHINLSHIFVLPTKGENFGHSIFEAFSIGRPALISDQTPWQNLKKEKCGWDIPLEKPEEWRASIEEAISWNQDELDLWCRCARSKAESYLSDGSLRQSYLKLFK